MRIKEKNQENNLYDYKLREIARNGEAQGEYLKPHAGMNMGLLDENLKTVLG